MFEKLVESNSAGAEFKKRKSYFMVSSLVVGILFVTAVVISIYAADYSLGSTSFELSQIVTPDEITPVEPEITRRVERATAADTSQMPTRQVNMLRPDEQPMEIPTGISVTPNKYRARPQYGFTISPVEGDGTSSGPIQRSSNGPGSPEGLAENHGRPPAPDTEVEGPPPAIRKEPISRKPVSKGVINGIAISLPKPVYSAAAKAVGAQGQVQVQVTIDEDGRVISANAINGNVLLRPEAERAARNARFTPTKLSDVPVKVTGVIIYNFTR